MSLSAKIILTLVALFALVAVGVISLGPYVLRYGRGLVEANDKQNDQGLAFGRQTDESGCLNEAVTRYKGNGGMTGYMPAGVFVMACWTTSRPTDGFCDQVPKPFDLLKGQRWQLEQSRRVGIDRQYGGQIFSLQQLHCESRVRPPALSPQ